MTPVPLTWAYLATVLILELTPGPNMGFLAAVTLRDGWRGGAVTVLGITLGLVTCLLASIGGLVELAAAQPMLLSALRWLGVGYFAWLALDAWRLAGGPVRHGRLPRAQLFARGFVSNLLNPKAALLYLALLPRFLTAGGGALAVQALALGLVHIAVSVAVHALIVISAASGRRVFARSDGQRSLALAQKASAVLLLGVALLLALS